MKNKECVFGVFCFFLIFFFLMFLIDLWRDKNYRCIYRLVVVAATVLSFCRAPIENA